MEERIEEKIVTILDKLNSKQYGYGIQGTYKAIADIIKICKNEFGVNNNELYNHNEDLINELKEKKYRINELESCIAYMGKTIESFPVDFVGKTTILNKTREILK